MLPYLHLSHSVRHGHGICCHSHIKATSKPQHMYFVLVMAYVVVPTSKPQYTSSWSWHTWSFPEHGYAVPTIYLYYVVVMSYLVILISKLRQSHNILRHGHSIRCRSHIKATTYYVVVMAYVVVPTSKPQRTSWPWHMLSFTYQS